MATHSAVNAITAPIAICVGRGFNETARTDSSPSHVSPGNYSRRTRLSPAPVGGYGNLKQLEQGSSTLAGLFGLAAFAVDGWS